MERAKKNQLKPSQNTLFDNQAQADQNMFAKLFWKINQY